MHRDARAQDCRVADRDAAFMGPGTTIYAVKGDTEIQLQILDVIDDGIPAKTIQLAKIVLGHL